MTRLLWLLPNAAFWWWIHWLVKTGRLVWDECDGDD